MITHLACAAAAVSWLFAFHVLWTREWAVHHHKRAAALTVGLVVDALAFLLFVILLINDAQGVLA